jgi:hypothetical protein
MKNKEDPNENNREKHKQEKDAERNRIYRGTRRKPNEKTQRENTNGGAEG